MVVCKFFLEGYCKFGSKCRFEHTNYYGYNNTSSGSYSGTSPLSVSSNEGRSILRLDAKGNENVATRSNHNEDIQSQDVRCSISTSDVVQVATRDTIQLEKGSQWPLTCYCPLKECGNLPGWDDHSPEEIRFESYNAFKNGTFATCKQAIDHLYKVAQERRMDIKNKEKCTGIIDNQMRNGPVKPHTTKSVHWMDQNNSSVFNNIQNSETTAFGTSVPLFNNNQSSFSNTGSFFGPTQTFGSASSFGTALNPVFSSTQSAQSPFESASPVFVPTDNPFGPQSSTASDITTVLNTQSNIVPQSSFTFSLDTQAKPTENVSMQNSSQTVQSKQKNSSDQDDNLIYSDISTLTPDEVSAFESQTFSFGYIPLKPPPKNMCGF